jgi:RAD51-like protein 1
MEILEKEIIVNRVNLLVIDSLASLVRRQFVGNDSSVLGDRSVFLSKISSRLKSMAQLLNVTIVVINQIQLSSYDESNISGVIPALGSSWAHFVNIRIILQFIDDQKRELLVAKSPSCPFLKYKYDVDEECGLSFDTESWEYNGMNPSCQRMKTKPYSY